MDELARPAIEALEARRVRFHPESQHRFAIESLENAPGLVRLAPALVGPPDPDLDVPRRPPDLRRGRRPTACAECGSGELVRETDVLDTWFSSALWPFATLGWPEQTPELERYYPGNVNVTAREIIRLWENRMIFSGLFLLGEIPFTDVIINSTVLAVDGRRMSKSLGTGIDPLEAVAQARRRRDPLRAAEDLLDPGRPLQLGRDRGGREAREQALERRAADPPEGGRRRAGARARRRSRSAGSPARIDETRAEIEELLPRFDFSHAVDCALPPHLRRLLRLVRRGDQAAALRRRRGCDRDRARRARAPARAAPPGAAARHRGDLVAVPRRTRLILGPWPETGTVDAGRRRAAMARVQSAAVTFRRSGALVALEGDEKRIFDAVVKPERRTASADGAVEAERERLRKEIARSERMLANERFVQNAPPRRRRGRAREARALPARARGTRRLTRRLARGALAVARGVRARPDARAARRPRRPAARLPLDPRRRHERQDLDDADDRRAPPRRRAARRGVHLAARPRLVRADPGRRRGRRPRRGARARPAARRRRDAVRGATAAALAEFAAPRVDVAVVEAGLGGRLDATNVLDARVVVLTNVSLEHTDVLGDTREAIAAEKLAVVSPGAVVVLGERRVGAGGARGRRRPRRGRRAARTSRSRVAAAEAFLGRPVDPAAAEAVRVPGRLEHRCEQPLEIWDGAHNLAGIGYLLPRLPDAALHDRRLDPRRQAGRRDAARAHGRSATRSSRPARRARARSPPTSSPASPRRTSRGSRPCPIPTAALELARSSAGPTVPFL